MAVLVARAGRELQRYSSDKGRRQVVGCIPYRIKEEKQEDEEQRPCSNNCIVKAMEVLMITSRKGGDATMFPKGGWEMDEKIEEAASREAVEEAGILGDLEERLGDWSFRSKRYGTLYDGYVFPLKVTEELDHWPEAEVRQRRWVTVAEARERCQQWWMKEALEQLVSRLSDESIGACRCESANVCNRQRNKLHKRRETITQERINVVLIREHSNLYSTFRL